jgi:hypothetical protein
MKTKIAALFAALTLLATPMLAGEPKTQPVPGAPALTVEQRFQEADVSLALAQYEKLLMAAFEVRLRLQVEPPADAKQRDEMARKAAELSERAMEIRQETIKRAEALAAAAR